MIKIRELDHVVLRVIDLPTILEFYCRSSAAWWSGVETDAESSNCVLVASYRHGHS